MTVPKRSTQIQAKTQVKFNLGQDLDPTNHKNQLTAVVASIETKHLHKDTKKLYID